MGTVGRSRCRWEDHFKMDIKKWNNEYMNEFSWLKMGLLGILMNWLINLPAS
jgi:hypothetical protein